MFPLNNKYREKLNPCMSRLVWLTCSNSIYMYQYWQGTSVMSKCRTGPNYSSLQWHEAVIDLLFWLCVTITMIQEDYSWDLLLQYFCCRFSLRQEPACSHRDPARPLWHADRHAALLWRPHHAHHRHSHGQNHVWIGALQFPTNTSGNYF